MPRQKSAYIDVDALLPRISLEQVADFYGVNLPELRRVGREIRTRCFLNCGREDPTGERALAIRADDEAGRWRCHQYGCGRGGNWVSLCDLLKAGPHADGRPRGERFRAIAEDLRAMVEGVVAPPETKPQAVAEKPASSPPRLMNVPLRHSRNERARQLLDLDEKFVLDPAEMPPAAAKYVRARPFLAPEVCRKWRLGYLPRSTGSDRRGGTMRGKVVYPLLSERGDVLTWFGRDPDFARKFAAWKQSGGEGREPVKYQFVKGFHRGLELFGQQGSRLEEPSYREAVERLGIVVVEGPNDVAQIVSLAWEKYTDPKNADPRYFLISLSDEGTVKYWYAEHLLPPWDEPGSPSS